MIGYYSGSIPLRQYDFTPRNRTYGTRNSAFDTNYIQINYDLANMQIPLSLHPDITVGQIETECVGKPCIDCANGYSGTSSNLVVTQQVKIKIPLHIGVNAQSNHSSIECSPESYRISHDPHL